MLRAPVLMRMKHIRDEGKSAGKTLRRKLSRREGGSVRGSRHHDVCNKDLKFTLSNAVYRPALSCCSRFRSDGELLDTTEQHVTIQITQGCTIFTYILLVTPTT